MSRQPSRASPDPIDDAPPLFDLAALEQGQPPLDAATLIQVTEALAQIEGRTEGSWLSDWPTTAPVDTPPPLASESVVAAPLSPHAPTEPRERSLPDAAAEPPELVGLTSASVSPSRRRR